MFTGNASDIKYVPFLLIYDGPEKTEDVVVHSA